MNRLILIFCIFFTTIGALQGAPTSAERGVILIISSYNPDTRRMSGFISEFEQQIVSSAMPMDIYVENLECRGVADAPIWMEQTRNVIDRYGARGLQAVVLLGQEAWATFISLDNFPKEVQVYACFASPNGVMLPPPSEVKSGAGWMPESVDMVELANKRSHHNTGGLLNRYDVNKNIDLITTLHPQTENIAFISDNTYGGISLQALVRKVMAEDYPNLKLTLLDSREGEQAVGRTYTKLPSKSAVLIGSWRVGCDGEYLMQRSLNDLIRHNTSIPVFSITGSGIGEVAIGGYIPKYNNGAKLISNQIIDSYKGNIAKQIEVSLTDGEYRFDSRKLKEFKIPDYALPKGSIVEDAMAIKLSKYSHYISLLSIALALLILLVVFICWLFFRTRRLTHTLESRERELVIAREKAEESDQLKSAFLANMSHEIRTPLNAIVGFSSLMGTDDLLPEERAEYSSIVINNSEMLLTLLNDILDISSLECGKTRFVYTSENLVEICRHVMMTTAHTRNEGVEGVFNPPCESFQLVTDSHRLSQIMINLLTNASKFTEQGSITLAFELNQQERMLYFSVTDTGEGIHPDQRETVFNRFEKLVGNKKKGTGLGLAICRQTVAILGGRIWVDPNYESGARFIFTHPLDLTPTETSEVGENIMSRSKGPQI